MIILRVRTIYNNKEITNLSYFYETDENEVPLILCKLLDNCKILNKINILSEINKADYYQIYVKIHSAQDILLGQASNCKTVCKFAQEMLLQEKDRPPIPIIHLSLSDMFIHSLYGTESLPPPVPRSYMIMDSSIWNYLVPISGSYYIKDFSKHCELRNKYSFNDWINEKDKEDNKNIYLNYPVEECLEKALKSICYNYKKKLYWLNVTREYAEFNARLAQQSFLASSHALGVSPFIFHSETCIEDFIKREFRNDKNNNLPTTNQKYCNDSLIDVILENKWRILLVDDKAEEPMRFAEDSLVDSSSINKITIIKDILESQLMLDDKIECRRFGKSNSTNDSEILLIEWVQSLEEAKEALKTKRYDIVLLDYLLKQKDGIHYGYELLEDIWNDQLQSNNNESNLKYKVAPDITQRLYCMFISAYPSAVQDRLLANGLNQKERFWHISVGACPTNTPQLFLYNLLKVMDKRLRDSGIFKLKMIEMLETLNTIYLPIDHKDNNKRHSVRKKANDKYRDILRLHYYYRRILKNVNIPIDDGKVFDTKGSVLMTNFIMKKVHMGGILEHLTQLVHLTAFGTVRQWPEMWEEYIYFKALFEKQINDDTVEKFRDLCENIEGYIVKLKNQQQ